MTQLIHEEGKTASGSKETMLELKSVSQAFGGLQVLSDISMTVEENVITGIIGPNGAGKSTLFNIMTGIYVPTEGRVHLSGEDITGQAAYKIARKGLGRTFQNIHLFKNMTVLDNVIAGMHTKGNSSLLDAVFHLKRKKAEDDRFEKKAEELLQLMGLWDKRYVNSSQLPYGEQRKLEIARALASDPKILLLDEPAAGMNEQETEDLRQTTEKLKEMGLTVVLIEHDMKFVMNVCEHIYVIDHGFLIAQGTPQQVAADPKVIEAYLGKDDEDE